MQYRKGNEMKKKLEKIKTIRVIQKLCNFYALSITIIKMKKLNKIIKIYLYSDITNLNDIIIKDVKYISYQQIVFDKMKEAK